MASTFLILLFLNFTTGCYYYRVQTYPKITADELITYDSAGKYLILHYADTAWHLDSLKVEGRLFTGTISPLPIEHQKYKTTTHEKSNRYRRSVEIDESDVIKEVHLFVNDIDMIQDSIISGRTYSITGVDVYNKDKRKTTLSWVLPFIIVPIPLLILVGISAVVVSYK